MNFRSQTFFWSLCRIFGGPRPAERDADNMRLVTILFAAGGAALLYSLAAQQTVAAVQPVSRPTGPRPPAVEAVASQSSQAAEQPAQQQSSQAASPMFWLPPSSGAPKRASPVSGCGPSPGNPNNQRAPVLVGRGSESALCATASGEQQVACKLAAAAIDGELLLLVGTARQSLESLRLRLM